MYDVCRGTHTKKTEFLAKGKLSWFLPTCRIFLGGSRKKIIKFTEQSMNNKCGSLLGSLEAGTLETQRATESLMMNVLLLELLLMKMSPPHWVPGFESLCGD